MGVRNCFPRGEVSSWGFAPHSPPPFSVLWNKCPVLPFFVFWESARKNTKKKQGQNEQNKQGTPRKEKKEGDATKKQRKDRVMFFGCNFFAYCWKLPAYSWAFFCLQSHFLILCLQFELFHLQLELFCLQLSFSAYNGKVCLRSTSTYCKQGSSTISKKLQL